MDACGMKAGPAELTFEGQMRSSGLFARMVSIEHLDALRNDIDALRKDGLFDKEFYDGDLAWLDVRVPDGLPDASTIVVVAKPKPMLSVTFRWEGRTIPLIVPPAYADGKEVEGEVLAALDRISAPNRYRYVKAKLPLKALAVRSGLAQYGRNNIAYIPTFGSFHRLAAFFTDMPCGEDHWQDMEMLPGCDSCTACLASCPTGAIPSDRMLLRGERCLTWHNEKDASVPFPTWIDRKGHNALVGCLRCQRACPYNKNVMSWMEAREEFSEEETALLLDGGKGAERLAERLGRVGLSAQLFPRNLEALLQAWR